MNGAFIMALESMFGLQTGLIKSHVISLRRRRKDRGEQSWGSTKGRSLTLTSSILLRIHFNTNRTPMKTSL